MSSIKKVKPNIVQRDFFESEGLTVKLKLPYTALEVDINPTGLTASRAVITNASNDFASSATTDTELGYVSGVSSAIQTQLDAKMTGAGSSTDKAVVRFSGTGGATIQNSGVIIDDSDNITEVGNITGGTGQMTVTGGTASGDDLLLVSTSNVTKGIIGLGSLTNGLVFDEENTRLSIGGDETTTTVNGVSKASSFSTHITGGGQDYTWISHVHSNSVGAVIAGARSRGSEASKSIVVDNDNLFDLFALGFDGTDYEQAAAIHMDVDGTPGDDDMPGRIVFLTTPVGGTSPTENMRIDSAGVITGKAGAMSLARISGSTFFTVQHLQDIFHSSGWVSGGVITDDADGTITVAAGTGLIRATDDVLAQIIFTDWAAESGTNVDLADNDINYIYVEYTGGTPAVFARTAESTDFNTKILLAVIQRTGTTLHINNAQKHVIGDHANSMIRRMQGTNKFARVTGAVISATGTRAWAITTGDFWEGLTEFTLAAFDSDSGGAGDTFSYWYRKVSDSGWNEVATQSAIHQTNYDDNSGSLATLNNNRYGVHWCYVETDDHAHVVYGQGNYTLSQAEDAQPPSGVPEVIEANGILVGKIIIKESGAAFTQIESAFATLFTPSVATDHGGLAGLGDDDHTQYILADGTRVYTSQVITDNAIVTVDSSTVANGEYAKFTANGLESKTFAEVKTDLSLNNVDNTSDANKPVSTAQQTEIDLQATDVKVDEIDTNVNDLITAVGIAENASDMGTYTGSTITDNQTAKQNIQELETGQELKAPLASPTFSGVVTSDGNINVNADIKIENVSPGLTFVDSDGPNTHTISASGITLYVGGDATASALVFRNKTSYGTSMTIATGGTVDVVGEFTAGTKTFKIDHPVVPTEKILYHAVIESPEHGLLYRGKSNLVNGKVTINIDDYFGMTPGTFASLTQDVIVQSLQNQDGFDNLKPGIITDSTFEIICEDSASTNEVAWMITAARKDALVMHSSLNDDNGRLITEVDKPIATAKDLKALDTEIIEVNDIKDVKTEIEIVDSLNEKKGYYRHPDAHDVNRPTKTKEYVLKN